MSQETGKSLGARTLRRLKTEGFEVVRLWDDGSRQKLNDVQTSIVAGLIEEETSDTEFREQADALAKAIQIGLRLSYSVPSEWDYARSALAAYKRENHA